MKRYTKDLIEYFDTETNKYANEVATHKGKLPRTLYFFDYLKMALKRRDGWEQISSHVFKYKNGTEITVERIKELGDYFNFTEEFAQFLIKVAQVELEENVNDEELNKILNDLKMELENYDQESLPGAFIRRKKSPTTSGKNLPQDGGLQYLKGTMNPSEELLKELE